MILIGLRTPVYISSAGNDAYSTRHAYSSKLWWERRGQADKFSQSDRRINFRGGNTSSKCKHKQRRML